MREKPTQLYRHFDADGCLLYVGISLSAVSRLSQHRGGSRWFAQIANIAVETFPTRRQALKAEAAAIAGENPKYNVSGLTFSDPEPHDFPPSPSRLEQERLLREETAARSRDHYTSKGHFAGLTRMLERARVQKGASVS